MNKVFIDIDTANDFFGAGSLPVAGADEIRPILEKITKLAKDAKIPILKTLDCHTTNDKEFAMFHQHCIQNTTGQASIRETAANKAIIFNKRTYNIFDNELGDSNFEKWLKDNKVTTVYVYGLVGNICVEAAVLGMLKMGIEVNVFENAVVWMNLERGIFCEGVDNKELSIDRMRKAGAHFVVAKL